MHLKRLKVGQFETCSWERRRTPPVFSNSGMSLKRGELDDFVVWVDRVEKESLKAKCDPAVCF